MYVRRENSNFTYGPGPSAASFADDGSKYVVNVCPVVDNFWVVLDVVGSVETVEEKAVRVCTIFGS